MTVLLDGLSLSLDDIVSVAYGRDVARLAPGVAERMQAHREVVVEALASRRQVYGLTTGVAERKRVTLGESDQARFNRTLLRNHLIAQGPDAAPEVVRATMLVLANAFAIGVSGVRPDLAELLIRALGQRAEPRMRTLGSVGQADLGPLADLADWLVEWAGFELAENEGLALIDTNAFSTATSALALGSVLFEEGTARNLQDPLTYRCVPQIHGAGHDVLAYTRTTVERELNSSQGNPVVVLAERAVISVGNFDPVAMAAALDFARIGLAPVVTSAAERTVKLLQAPTSGLAAGLSAQPATGDDGLAELAVAVQSFAAEARLLAQPVSFELTSTSKAEGIEDRTTMAALSGRRLDEMVAMASRVVAVGLVVAAKAIDLRRLGRLGTGTQALYDLVRRHIPAPGADTPFPRDLEPLVGAVRSGEVSGIVKALSR